jgi:hypothetical protein
MGSLTCEKKYLKKNIFIYCPYTLIISLLFPEGAGIFEYDDKNFYFAEKTMRDELQINKGM